MNLKMLSAVVFLFSSVMFFTGSLINFLLVLRGDK